MQNFHGKRCGSLTPIVFILSGLAVSVEGVYTKLKAVGAGDVVVRILVAV